MKKLLLTTLFLGIFVLLSCGDDDSPAVQNASPLIQDQSFAIEENSALGTLVGTIMASDPDDDELNYTIQSGNIDNAFILNANSGEVSVANAEALDYETNPQFQLEVSVSDGDLSDNATITIDLMDLNESVSKGCLLTQIGSATLTFNGSGLLIELRDGGDAFTFNYNSGGELTGIQSNFGESYTITNQNGLPVTIDGTSDTWQVTYDENGYAVAIESASEMETATFEYDANGNMISWDEGEDESATYSYDDRFNPFRTVNIPRVIWFTALDYCREFTNSENNVLAKDYFDGINIIVTEYTYTYNEESFPLSVSYFDNSDNEQVDTAYAYDCE